jgi:hypothetical protein
MIFALPLIVVLFTHWLSDFVLQTHWQATNKSKSLVALSRHVGVYTAVLTLVTVTLGLPIWYGVLNGGFHFLVDYFTSKKTARLHQAGDTKKFWAVIGFDQFLHAFFLIMLMPMG